MARMSAANTVCLYGEGDDDSICPKVAPRNATVVKLAGGHHFGGGYVEIAEQILNRLPTAPGGSSGE
jgi:type IV secretory pathway VirJ component